MENDRLDLLRNVLLAVVLLGGAWTFQVLAFAASGELDGGVLLAHAAAPANLLLITTAPSMMLVFLTSLLRWKISWRAASFVALFFVTFIVFYGSDYLSLIRVAAGSADAGIPDAVSSARVSSILIDLGWFVICGCLQGAAYLFLEHRQIWLAK